MANFCTKCGKPLVDGQPCSCQSTAAADTAANTETVNAIAVNLGKPDSTAADHAAFNNAAPDMNAAFNNAAAGSVPNAAAPNVSKEQVTNYLSALVAAFLTLLRSPASYGKSFVAACNHKLALGLIGIQGLLVALFALLASNKVGSYVETLVGFYADTNIKMPYFRIFVLTLVVSLILSLVLAGLLFLSCMIFKNQISYQKALCITGLRSVAVSPIIVIALVVYFLNPIAGLVVFYMGNLYGICTMLMVLPITVPQDENKLPLILFLAIAVFAGISVFVMSKCAVYYIPDSIRDMIGSISSLPDLLNQLY